MTDSDKQTRSAAGRQRLEELREKRNLRDTVSIRRARTTVIINILIEICSGLIFCVGALYAVRFLNIRRPFMEPMHYRLFLSSFGIVSAGWLFFLIGKIRRNWKHLRELSLPGE